MNRWLTLVAFGVLSILVVAFFTLWLRPIKRPNVNTGNPSLTLTEPTVTFVNPALGPASAKAVFVVFGDFMCEACHDLLSNLLLLQQRHVSDVRIVWKDLPNDEAHAGATDASLAGHCADRQQKFWPFVERLLAEKRTLGTELYPALATELGMNVEAFNICLEQRDTLPIVQKDTEEGFALGIEATPTVFVNGQRIVGAMNLDELERYVLEARTSR